MRIGLRRFASGLSSTHPSEDRSHGVDTGDIAILARAPSSNNNEDTSSAPHLPPELGHATLLLLFGTRARACAKQAPCRLLFLRLFPLLRPDHVRLDLQDRRIGRAEERPLDRLVPGTERAEFLERQGAVELEGHHHPPRG